MANREKAESLKERANECMKSNKLVEALKLYTEAINIEDNNPILYNNRSMCNYRLESYGDSITDASQALSLDPKFAKAYYRRGCAYMCIMKHKLALKDFSEASKILPNDKLIGKKVKEVQSLIYQINFANAISITKRNVFDEIDLASLKTVFKPNDKLPANLYIPADYNDKQEITNIPDLTGDFVDALIDFYAMSDTNNLPNELLLFLIKSAYLKAKTMPNIIRTYTDNNNNNNNNNKKGNVVVFGDVHGQYEDMLKIYQSTVTKLDPTKEKSLNGTENISMIFNGDFVDRGPHSVRVMAFLLANFLAFPGRFFLNRGNHESLNMNQMFGFEKEVHTKYNSFIFRCFTEFFNTLPIVHLIDDEVFVVHGGLPSTDGVTLDEINKIDRFREPNGDLDSAKLLTDLLWADPTNLTDEYANSPRGVSKQFGVNVTNRFCQLNKLKYIVRSHEVKEGGYEVAHAGKCITVFSAPRYCGEYSNKAACLIFGRDCADYKVETFD